MSYNLSDADLKDYCSLGYNVWSTKLNNVTFQFRTLTESQLNYLFSYGNNVSVSQYKVLVLVLTLNTIITKTAFLTFPESEDYNTELYDFFYGFPYVSINILSQLVFDKTNALATNVYEIISDKELFDKKTIVISGLTVQLPKNYSFLHTILKTKKENEDLYQKTEIAWSYVKFLASMTQPKFIKDLERRENMKKNPASLSELEFEELSSLVGEEKARAIIEKMKNKEYVVEGEDDTEIYGLGQSSEESILTPKMPVGYRLDANTDKYVTSEDVRDRKEALYLSYLDTTPDDRLDRHDKLMKKALQKNIDNMKVRVEKHKNREEVSITEVTTRYEQAEKDPKKAQELLKNPIFVAKRRKK